MSVEWGSQVKPDVIAGSQLETNLAALDMMHASAHICRHFTHVGDPCIRVAVMSAGGTSGEPLDDSNAATLETMARAWVDDDRTGYGADDADDTPDVDWHPMNGNGSSSTLVCVNASAIDSELLSEIIAAAEAFAEYPVLDESDYSEREMAAWDEAMRWELRDVPESNRSAVAAAVHEARWGWAEAGWVDPTWVTEAMHALGLTRRRVRTLGTSPSWGGARAIVNRLAMSEDGELDWFPTDTTVNHVTN